VTPASQTYTLPTRGAVMPYQPPSVERRPQPAPAPYTGYSQPVPYAPPQQPARINAASQIRLIGSRDALEDQIVAFRTAGFQLVAENVRKVRDTNKNDLIYTATLIT
jgi:hypothetical protein